jgi:DNA topoisomerase-1
MPPKKTKEFKNTLIIVESPAKCKKIEEYLGPGYKCIASYGHLRNIISLKNIDITNNFKPIYTIIDEPIKRKQIEILRKEIKNASEVILASDDDREGEMISFSLIELFNLPLNTKRITFNEITESALQSAIKNP